MTRYPRLINYLLLDTSVSLELKEMNLRFTFAFNNIAGEIYRVAGHPLSEAQDPTQNQLMSVKKLDVDYAVGIRIRIHIITNFN